MILKTVVYSPSPFFLGKSDKIPCVLHVFAVLEISSKVSWPFHQEEIFTSDPGTFHEAPHSWEVAFHALSRWKWWSRYYSWNFSELNESLPLENGGWILCVPFWVLPAQGWNQLHVLLSCVWIHELAWFEVAMIQLNTPPKTNMSSTKGLFQ